MTKPRREIYRGIWSVSLSVFGAILVVAGLMASRKSAAAAVWHNETGFRWIELPSGRTHAPGFQRLSGAVTGIQFTNVLSEARSIANRNLLSGSGVAAGDVDGDGWCDLYFCGLDGDNVLYRNLGNWKFEDITARAGVAGPNLDAMGATFADIDGDGDVDLLVNTLGEGTKVFENDGRGVFKNITDRAGVASKAGSMSMALGDVDGNGTLDLYVANYRPTTLMDQPSTRFRFQMVNGVPQVTLVNGQPATLPEYTNRFVLAPTGKVLELGESDVLYLNDGKGHFTPVSFTGGAFLDEDGTPLRDAPRDWSLAVQIHDLNDDGAPDIYLCSDLFTPDRIWINDGKGRFRALPRVALRNTSTFSMGVDFADINRDEHTDFFVTDMFSRDHTKRHTQVAEKSPTRSVVGVIENRPQFGRNTLQLNRGDGTFAEIGFYGGVEASEWSWGPIFLDVDLDGYEDLLVPNGQGGDFQNADVARRIEEIRAAKQMSPQEQMNLMKLYPRLDTENLLFRNRGDCTFEEVGAQWGFNARGISQGMCLADLDNDGDLDVVMNNLYGEAGVYRNEGTGARVAVRLKGLASNSQGIGAKITVLGGAVPVQIEEIICGGRYLSGDDPIRGLAAGSLTNRLRIEVTWRNGKRSVVENARPNCLYEINEAGAVPAGVKSSKRESVEALNSSAERTSSTGGEIGVMDRNSRSTLGRSDALTLFEDASHLLQHTHTEEPFDDFTRQPLLPNRLSQLGPGVSWFDVNGDSNEDLLIGSGKSGALNVLLNDGRGGFKQERDGIWSQNVTRDQTTILGIDSRRLLVGSANYEDGLALGGAVKLFDATRNIVEDAVTGQAWSTGPMALADVDSDGDLDLFVGGRVIPGRHPQAATSLLFKNDGGKFMLLQKLERVGLVSGAVFSDLDGDGKPELILACEWGPIRVFRNEQGKFTLWDWPVTLNAQRSTLNELTGWWNGVTTGDFDGDGRLDMVASNWGLNSKYRASREHPLKLYWGDIDGNGIEDIIEASYDATMKQEVPERGLKTMLSAIPLMQEKWTSFEAYGRASALDIHGEKLKTMAVLEVTTLASMVFMNRGDHFEATQLPREAQFAPAFGVCVCDADGDGNEDVFLSQNFFAVNSDSARCDAGRGLWLRGNGKGKLTSVPGQDSGVIVYGEQRGCAVADYDGDGRVDLAVAQNGNATKLYHNIGAKAGMRVRLKGGPNNPFAVGASLRLVFGRHSGPVREIHAGSGYWSQDSSIEVLGKSGEPTHLWVRWPGGKTTTSDVPTGALTLEVDGAGKVAVLR